MNELPDGKPEERRGLTPMDADGCGLTPMDVAFLHFRLKQEI